MKRLAALLIFTGFLSSVWAQDPPPMEGPAVMPPSEESFGMEGPEPDSPPPRDNPVDKWLEHLRDRNPDEYARLNELRLKDPEKFHAEMYRKLQRQQAMEVLEKNPRFKQLFGELPGEERDRITELISQPVMKKGPGKHGKPNPEIEKMEAETQELSLAYRKTQDNAERQKIRADIQTKLEILFDLRQKDREQMIAHMEKRMADLRKNLDEKTARRDELIGRRLKELTEGDPLAW